MSMIIFNEGKLETIVYIALTFTKIVVHMTLISWIKESLNLQKGYHVSNSQVEHSQTDNNLKKQSLQNTALQGRLHVNEYNEMPQNYTRNPL